MAALRKSAVMGSRKTPLIRAAGASGVMPSGMQGAGEDRRSAIAISLLGRLQVRDADGAEIAISGYKARALLGYLAVSLGNAIPRSHLATMLWGGRSDRPARDSLKQAVWHLRRNQTCNGTNRSEDRGGGKECVSTCKTR